MKILYWAVISYSEFIYLLARIISPPELYPKFFLNYYYYFFIILINFFRQFTHELLEGLNNVLVPCGLSV